ncbi:glycosyltransferase family 2 protein [Catenibacterium mitsuokai]|uniref:glycosyltransferase family 2 protein n=1 Tax=Catenibacterium mitsuokai TaxID=100886 RepID=UPI003F92B4CC
MISIIIPIYNAEKYLNRMLSSIKEQTYTDYELLLINDGSIDCSELICKEAQKQDKRIRYLSQSNRGVSSARNLGIKEAKGEFITFLDADDKIDSNYLFELYKECNKADISVCKVIVENECGKELFEFNPRNRNLDATEALNYLLSRIEINSGPYAKMFRKQILESVKFPNMKTYEDIIFNIKAFSNAKNINCIDSVAYHYIQNSDSTMNNFMKTPSLDIINATTIIMDFIQENNQISKKCEYITLSHLYQYINSMLIKNKIENTFFNESLVLYRKYYRRILANNYFSAKEKVLFGLFCLRIGYINKKIIRF